MRSDDLKLPGTKPAEAVEDGDGLDGIAKPPCRSPVGALGDGPADTRRLAGEALGDRGGKPLLLAGEALPGAANLARGDDLRADEQGEGAVAVEQPPAPGSREVSVSYTHLTLPTIYSV